MSWCFTSKCTNCSQNFFISNPIERIINNLAYAEPVCFGTNLPPSWGKVYRTRQKTVAGFPELIGKELEQYARREYERIKRGI